MAQYALSTWLVWQFAAFEAKAGNSPQIEPVHFMLGLGKSCDVDVAAILAGLQNPPDAATQREAIDHIRDIRQLFAKANITITPFRRTLRQMVAQPAGQAPDSQEMHRSNESRRLFQRAEQIADSDTGAKDMLLPRHLLYALMESPNTPWQTLLEQAGITGAFNLMFGDKAGYTPPEQSASDSGSSQPTPASETPILDKYGRDLTALARAGKLDPVIGRRDEMKKLAQILIQKQKNNAILVGDPGVGKTCIIEGFAQLLVGGKLPADLSDKRILQITMSSLVAGSKYRGEFEERMEGLIAEVTSHPDIILFIDEIHTLLGSGGEGAHDAANILKPALSRSDMRIIGATTTDEYRKTIEKDGALDRRFQRIWIDEPTRDEAVLILKGIKHKFEEHHKLEITEEAIEAAVDLSLRYLPDLRLPDKAVNLIDQACSQARLSTLTVEASQTRTLTVGKLQIAKVVAEQARLPLTQLTESESDRLLKMEESLKRRLMGQDEAVSVVSKSVRTARAGLKPANKPVGVFMFVGATGTGKTELAKALAEFLFGDERRLIRVDMSEYTQEHTVSRLIGSPPGYVGYEEEGQLTGPIRTYPYSVVLFDEIEKAHPRVLDIMLQIFDEGRLTDGQGRRASFTESIIIMTSNLGYSARQAPQPLGFSTSPDERPEIQVEDYRKNIMSAIQQAMRPELLNRINNIVFFYPLSEEAVRLIIDKIIRNLVSQLASRHITFDLTESTYELLMKEGFSPQYGAREMERTIQRLIVQPLGEKIIGGSIMDGQSVHVDTVDGVITFK